MNVQHSARCDGWMTPPEIVERVRQTLGGIDLDPASTELANVVVGAERIYTAADDGLSLPWYGSVYCNPPGGKRGNKSLAGLFWSKLMREMIRGDLEHAVFMGFSVELLQSTQKPGPRSAGDFPFCVPAKRIPFVHPTAVEKVAPTHSNVIVYVPGRVDYRYRFEMAFESLGKVVGV